MLYDPKWGQNKTPTMAGFVAWLETKDPHETYNWASCAAGACGCAVSQYFHSLQYDSNNVSDYVKVRAPLEEIAMRETTFGRLLERAKLAAAS